MVGSGAVLGVVELGDLGVFQDGLDGWRELIAELSVMVFGLE